MESLFAYFDTIHPLPLEAKTSIARICTLQTVKKNQVLQAVGHTCRTIYFIKRGLARIYYFKVDTDVTEFFALRLLLRIHIHMIGLKVWGFFGFGAI